MKACAVQGLAADVAQIISNALSVHVVSPLAQTQFTNPTLTVHMRFEYSR